MNLTAEQREAIRYGIVCIEADLGELVAMRGKTDYSQLEVSIEKDQRKVAMLEGLIACSKPAWEVTEERQKAIHRAIRGMTDQNLHHSTVELNCAEVLRAMMEEIEK